MVKIDKLPAVALAEFPILLLPKSPHPAFRYLLKSKFFPVALPEFPTTFETERK